MPKFKEYDKDGNGFITVEEASCILQKDPFNFPSQKVSVGQDSNLLSQPFLGVNINLKDLLMGSIVITDI